MTRIQSTTGLVTGLDIDGLVNKLVDISAANRNRLRTRTDKLMMQQVAAATLGGLVASVRVSVNALGKASNYQALKVASSNATALSATLTGTPAVGTYEFTPLQAAQGQKNLSTGFKSTTEAIGAGTITVRFGDHVERGASLSLANGGVGITRGSIRIGDRSGAVATINLSTARSIDDVLAAINGNTTINVTATTRDGRIVLTDNTGQASANLRVLEMPGGRTAASLGLSGIDTASNVGEGADVYGLFGDLDLDYLNDGSGVRFNSVLPDVGYVLRDGTTGTIDFNPLDSPSGKDDTIAKILARIGADSDGKLKAEIAADGRRLVVTDLTEGEGEFTLTALNDSAALVDLGIDQPAVDGVITGGRILGGLRTVTLSSLNGGQGFGELGAIQLTDRSGASAVVDLSGAETLEELIETINSAGVAVRAQINQARNGIELVDTSGSTAGNLIVADADGTNSATKLQIAADVSNSTVNSGDMHLQIISRNTLLSSLNGGKGVAVGQFMVADSTGSGAAAAIRVGLTDTVGDVIDAINRLHLAVKAEINATGDGILLRDTAGGSSTIKVTELGGGTAADLGLLGWGKLVDVEGESQQQIDGSMTRTLTIGASDTLEDLQETINALGAGFSVSTISDGSVRPYRLMLASDRAGQAGALVIDTSQAAFSFSVTAEAQDAMLAYGAAANTASAVLVASRDNTFSNLVNGMTLKIGEATGTTVSVTVSASYATVKAAAQSFVENYNKYRQYLSELTAYNSATEERGLLNGDVTILRMETQLTRLVTSRFNVGGSYGMLEQIGICFEEDGTLSYNDSMLDAALEYDPKSLEQLFATKETGATARFATLIEQLAGEANSLLSRRLDALDDRITDDEARIKRMDASLEVERERLLMSFYNMELAVSRIQSNLGTLDSIGWIVDQYRAKS